MRAVLLEVNWLTGERPGIKPEDLRSGGKYASLVSPGPLTQSLPHEPKGDFEIRLVTDPTLDISELEAIGGEVILDDGTVIESPITSPDQIPQSREIVDVNGVVIIEGEETINRVVDAAIPDKYFVPDLEAFRRWCQENGIKLKVHPQRGLYDAIREAYLRGCPYVQRHPEPRVKNGRWTLG